MAASGFTPIQLYRTTTASAVPTSGNLADGELAINTTDEKLYFKNAAGTVKLLASTSSASGAAGGSNTQIQYNSSGVLAGSANLTFDGTTLTANTMTGKLKGYTEVVTTSTVSTSTSNIDTSLSNVFDITLGNNVTFTFTNAPSSGTSRPVTIILRQDATGNRTASFTNAKYTNGAAPTLSTGANEIDVLTFFTVNGGTFWFGTFAMANVS
jgi:hypothetical protein